MLVAVCGGCSLPIPLGEKKTELRVGLENIGGSLNPFYASGRADEVIMSQIFTSIQRENGNGRLVNYDGGVTYICEGDNVKYTVNISDNLYFSDGTNVTIEDVMFFYYLISDATYDGIYSDFHLNDIRGLKAYYYDDENYEASLAAISARAKEKYDYSTISPEDYINYLEVTSLEGEWTGVDGVSPYGGTWKDLINESGFGEKLSEAGSESSKQLAVACEMMVLKHPYRYNPREWWEQKLIENYIKKNYEDGIDVTSIEGIKKINDYACTVSFSSRNINAVSALNAVIVSKKAYSAEYRKGNAEAIRSFDASPMGCGAFSFSEKDDSGDIILKKNEFRVSSSDCFDRLVFTDLAGTGDKPSEALKSGKVDIIEFLASKSGIVPADNDISTVLCNDDKYYSFFLNADTIDSETRAKLCSDNEFSSVLNPLVGDYYTLQRMPIDNSLFEGLSANQSIIGYYFASASKEVTTIPVTEPVTEPESETAAEGETATTVEATTEKSETTTVPADESEGATEAPEEKPDEIVYTREKVETPSVLNLCYPETVDDAGKAVVDSFAEKVTSLGFSVNKTSFSDSDFEKVVFSGNADIWFCPVSDRITGDKYDYYHTKGLKNHTSVSDKTLDELLVSNRSEFDYSVREENMKKILSRAVSLNFELPVYQGKLMVSYRNDRISASSVPDIPSTRGLKYALQYLEPAER